jgi:hypothetical protein
MSENDGKNEKQFIDYAAGLHVYPSLYSFIDLDLMIWDVLEYHTRFSTADDCTPR